MSDAPLFDLDVVAWSEDQVVKLRRLAASAPSNAIDWENVIEEIESVGRSRRRKVESLVENAFIHLLKILSSPKSLSARQWRREVEVFLGEAAGQTSQILINQLDLDALWRRASHSATAELNLYGETLSLRAPVACPYTLSDLLAGDADVDLLLGRLS